jgi:hypothetical protein
VLPEAVEFAWKAAPVVIGGAISLVGSVVTLSFRHGFDKRARQAELENNSGEHEAIKGRLEAIDKKASAAHNRIDEHDRTLARLDERGMNTLSRMEQFGESMERLRSRIDELLMRLGKARE